MRRLHYLLPLFALVFLLSGCSDESEAKENLLKYPQGVQDGKVSSQFYDQVREYEQQNMNFVRYTIESENLFDPNNQDQMLKHFNDHQDYLAELEIAPKTSADKKVFKEINKVNSLMKEFNQNYIETLTADDKTKAFLKFSNDNDLIIEQMINYRENAIKILEDNEVTGLINN